MLFLKVRKVPFRASNLLKLGLNRIQSAGITSRSTRGCPLKLEKPFPYQTKKFLFYHSLFDNTILRVSQENAKIVVVDGPIAAGKSAFAKVLAEELDMVFIPQPSVDILYTLPSGYNLRQHDHELPKIARSFDHKDFCVDPKDVRTGLYQFNMMFLRFFQNIDAMTHLLNTGQGVVLERNYYSDSAFMKAMYDCKYVSKEVYKTYFEVYQNTSTFFLPPHLVIYLDVPVPVVQERIRTRNYSYEQNSPALTKEYLQALEKYWKKDYLKKMSECSEILVYDWSDGGDVELIVEDIEKLDFDILREDGKFEYWQLTRKQWNQMRRNFTNNRNDLIKYHRYISGSVDELNIPQNKFLKLNQIMSEIPECQYDIGYNPAMGDSILKILFKSGEEDHRRLKNYLLHHVEK